MNDLKMLFYGLEKSLTDPETRRSREQIDRLLAEDFLEIGSSGNLYTKEHELEHLPASTEKTVYEITDFQARALSADLVQTIFKTKRTINDTDVVFSLRSSLWRKNGDAWQMVYHQGTPTTG